MMSLTNIGACMDRSIDRRFSTDMILFALSVLTAKLLN